MQKQWSLNCNVICKDIRLRCFDNYFDFAISSRSDVINLARTSEMDGVRKTDSETGSGSED